MSGQKRSDRRSFLARILGGVVVAGGAMGAVTGSASAQSYSGRTDADSRDAVNYGRGRTGLTDSDSTDTSGNGRGRQTGLTDSDSTDANGNGRGRQTGLTDSDSTDANGNGRGGRRSPK